MSTSAATTASTTASGSSTPTLYLDYMSQPSRACLIFVGCNNLPVKVHKVYIHKGETRTKEYRALNPLGKVPFLQDGALALPESGAIISYLAAKYNVPEHWCPRSDIAAQAQFNCAVHWYHNNIRAGCARLVYNTVIAPRLGQVPKAPLAEDGRDIMEVGLRQLASVWLQKGDRPFMLGDKVSGVDLLCCCEIEQLSMLDKDKHGTDLEDTMQRHPMVRAWMQRVQQACAHAYEQVHQPLRKMTAPANSKL